MSYTIFRQAELDWVPYGGDDPRSVVPGVDGDFAGRHHQCRCSALAV